MLRIHKYIFVFVCLSICFSLYSQTLFCSKINNECIIRKQYITISYNRVHNIPNYVGEIITPSMVDGNFQRLNRFYAEPDYTSVSHATYTGSGYDRGHMAPAADFKGCKQGMYESFSICNVAPQLPELNRQYWFMLEEHVRSLALKCDKMYIVTGTIIGRNNYINTVIVPVKFYKAIIGVKNNKKVISCAWIYRNVSTKQTVSKQACSIDYLESKIGYNLFPYLNRNNPKIEAVILQ